MAPEPTVKNAFPDFSPQRLKRKCDDGVERKCEKPFQKICGSSEVSETFGKRAYIRIQFRDSGYVNLGCNFSKN